MNAAPLPPQAPCPVQIMVLNLTLLSLQNNPRLHIAPPPTPVANLLRKHTTPQPQRPSKP